MRLLNTRTFKLEEFPDYVAAMPYAILSHVWGKHEQTYRDVLALIKRFVPRALRRSVLSSKIINCCRLALSWGYERVWIDTYCISKCSSAELSEAINSMFEWYQWSGVCIAYLEDVPCARDDEEQVAIRNMRKSQWFTRGWTLQELLAPKGVFVSQDWSSFGTEHSLGLVIEQITGIDIAVLTGHCPLFDVSIVKRMS
jgi:hypothetical protein